MTHGDVQPPVDDVIHWPGHWSGSRGRHDPLVNGPVSGRHDPLVDTT
jgi:hypothetical protein